MLETSFIQCSITTSKVIVVVEMFGHTERRPSGIPSAEETRQAGISQDTWYTVSSTVSNSVSSTVSSTVSVELLGGPLWNFWVDRAGALEALASEASAAGKAQGRRRRDRGRGKTKNSYEEQFWTRTTFSVYLYLVIQLFQWIEFGQMRDPFRR